MEAELQAGSQAGNQSDRQTDIHTYIHACIHTYIHTYIHTKVRTHKDTDSHMNPTAQPHEPHTISATNADSLQPITVHRAIALKCISVCLSLGVRLIAAVFERDVRRICLPVIAILSSVS